jgi:hypothetical protein
MRPVLSLPVWPAAVLLLALSGCEAREVEEPCELACGVNETCDPAIGACVCNPGHHVYEDECRESYRGPIQVSAIWPSCTVGDPDRWAFEVELEGRAGALELEIVETAEDGSRSEVHRPVSALAWDEEAWAWEEWVLELERVSAPAEVVSGQTTLFDCTYDDGQSLAFKVAIFDDEDALLDCAVWGHGAQSVSGWDGCVCFDC